MIESEVEKILIEYENVLMKVLLKDFGNIRKITSLKKFNLM